jgi:ribosomal protein S27AE
LGTNSLLAQGFRFSWQARPAAAEAKKSTRAKFTCAACGQNAWAKPDARLLCGICHEENGTDGAVLKRVEISVTMERK